MPTAADGSTNGTLKPCASDVAPPVPTPPTLYPPSDLPTRDGARGIAQRVLRNLGVLEGADWTFSVTDGGTVGIAISCAADAKCVAPPSETFTVSRNVLAERVVDGQPVAALGWSVEVGDHGLVTTIAGTLVDIRPVGDSPLRSIDAARRSLEAGDGSRPVPAVGRPTAEVTPAPTEPTPCPPDASCSAPTPVCPELCAPSDVTITITGVSLGVRCGSAATHRHRPSTWCRCTTSPATTRPVPTGAPTCSR
jgi:hypothetical protein